ncbi:hypothetical protein PJN21_29135, partial [Mycobacterium kansasii]
DRVKVAQQDLGLLPPDAELKALGQTSYFPRVYRVGKIVEERDKFPAVMPATTNGCQPDRSSMR